jgi:hypothetical protein
VALFDKNWELVPRERQGTRPAICFLGLEHGFQIAYLHPEMAGTIATLALATALFGATGYAQDAEIRDLNQTTDLSQRLASLRGWHLYSASVYMGYSTSAYPQAGIALNDASRLSSLGGDTSYGGMAVIGGQYQRPKTNLSLTYSGGYGGMIRYTDVNGFNHSLSIDLSRELTKRWTASLSGSGTENTTAQFLFQPERMTESIGASMSFDDFAAAAGIGQFSNAQIASMLTGAPALVSPARTLLLGDRVLSYAAQAGLAYTYSSRLQFHISSFSAAGQRRQGGSDVAVTNYAMPRSTGVNGGVGVSYMLSPRTTVGVDADEFYTSNRFQAARGTSVTASVGRKMGMHWFMRVYGGGSNMQTVRSVGAAPPTNRVIGGGSLGIKTYSQTLTGSYDRSTYDVYGFAAGLDTTIAAGWRRERPGSRWRTFAGFGQQQLRDNGFASLSGWRASGGIAFRLQSQTVVTVEYAHLRSTGTFSGKFNELSIDTVRVSLGWVPARSR